MGLAAAPPSAKSSQSVVRVDALSRVLQVPGSVLSFLEGQFPEVRSIATPPGRAYRMADAMFLAGLVEALYHEGRPFREVQEEARSSGRAALVRRGATLLGVDVDRMRTERPSAAVPPDAIVRRRGPQPEVQAAAPPPLGGEAILHELMDCVRLLGEARRGGSQG